MTGGPDRFLTEAERFPLLTDDGRRMLRRLQEHPHAPRYNFACGDRLTAADLTDIAAYEKTLSASPQQVTAAAPPPWLAAFLDHCFREVPFYRRRSGQRPERFTDLPTMSRADLAREPWSLVPDGQPLDRLLTYYTSGTTGKPVFVLSHPVTAGSYLAHVRSVLTQAGIELRTGPNAVALACIAAQQHTLTYPTVCTYLDEAGYVKINLNPHEWRHPDDCAAFLNDLRPQVITGDPVGFQALMRIPLDFRPKALFSSALQLTPALKTVFETHFACPLFDVYSLHEARFLAVGTAAGFLWQSPDVLVEVLDPSGQPCPPTTVGEITITSRRNPFLPLLRYRTGDFGHIQATDKGILIRDFHGRPPTLFVSDQGALVNTLDVLAILSRFPLAEFSLVQQEDRSCEFFYRPLDVWDDPGAAPDTALEQSLLDSLRPLLGTDFRFHLRTGPEPAGGKLLPFVSKAVTLDALPPEAGMHWAPATP